MTRVLFDRRELLAGLGAAAVAACARTGPVGRAPEKIDYLAHARGAARYIRANAVRTPHGLAWRKSPDEPGELGSDLYHGAPGVALFLLELHRATGDTTALDEATRTLAHVVATWSDTPDEWTIGLHGGLAGHAFTLHALAAATGDATHRTWLADAIGRLDRAAPATASGRTVHANEMLYGGAGIALTLLALAEADDRAMAMAIAFGDGLLARAQPGTTRGKRWLMLPEDERELPNFSHGTAGVAYALARLYEVTRESRFLDAALAGADHVLSLAFTDGDICLVPHSIPDGNQRYYLAYCHGPAGTARLFHQLHHVTRDAKWAGWFRKSINGVLYSGLPEQRSPGFWDNVGQCCGTAAIVELALSLHRLRDDPAHRAWADTLVEDIARRATRGPDGALEWIHAENRIEPFWRQSYTGYMQGAAGIGSMFVRLAAHDAHEPWKLVLPDNPWPA